MRSFRALLAFSRPHSQMRGSALPSVEEWPLLRMSVTTGHQAKNPLGCEFRTAVVDTGSSEEDAPAVLLLHDIPGSHREIATLIGSFRRQGARVIAANFPGNAFSKGLTPQDDILFSYSASDHADFVDAILAELELKRLDGLVTCGFAALPALHLLNSVSHLYSAACLLNPPRLPPVAPLPSLLSSSFPFLWRSSSPGRALCRALLRAGGINRRLPHPVAFPDEAAYALLTLQNSGSKEEVADLLELTSELANFSLLLVSAAGGGEGADQLFSALEGSGPVRRLEESCAEQEWSRWERVEADCRPEQLTKEIFFTDKIAAIFLRAFAKDERRRRLESS